MSYHFSPAADSERLQAALIGLYGEQAAADQLARYQKALAGLEATFGPCGQAALFSAPGRTEIGGNHTDHQQGRVLCGSVDLDMLAAVRPQRGHGCHPHPVPRGIRMDEVGLDKLCHPGGGAQYLRGPGPGGGRQVCPGGCDLRAALTLCDLQCP